MCGRIAQPRGARPYIDLLQLSAPIKSGIDPEPIGRYNVAPGTRVHTLHWDPDGIRWEPIKWGWKPFWSDRPASVNARSETVAHGKYFKPVWETGRCIVAADGWFEWVGEKKGEKQPFFIHRKDDAPVYLAAIGQFNRVGNEQKPDDGFVLITSSSEGGMLDVHDRRPIVLAPEAAAQWLDPDLSSGDAEQILLNLHEPVEAMTWHPVTRAVGNYRNQGPELIEPIAV